MRVLISLFITIACLCLGPAGAEVPQSRAQIQLSFAPLVRQAAPAVVNIFANRIVADRTSPFRGNPMFEDLFRQFDQVRPRMQNSLGSGVILSDDGIVVSNYHVVGMATEIRVVLTDRREFQARVLLADEEIDLAVLKIESDRPLPWLDLRDSDEVEVGQLVLAIGNPFGVGQTVSSGIVSGLARSGIATGNARGYFIQTDAPINPGNSGGALIDLNGDLVGINTSILTRSGGSNGIGFAIPANLVARFVDQAKSGADRFTRPWAGLNGQEVDSMLASGFGLEIPEGVVISALHPLSPFRNAGLKEGDIVLHLDDFAVNTPAEMLFRMSVRPMGENIRVRYRRGDIQAETEVVLMPAPDEPPSDRRLIQTGTLAGLEVANINPAVQSEYGLATSSAGVIVLGVPGGLQRVGLRPGDILLAINGVNVVMTADIEQAALTDSRAWRIDVNRGNRRITIRFRI